MERKEAIEVVKSNWPSSGYTMLLVKDYLMIE